MAIRASKRNWENKKTPSGKIKSSGRKAGEGWKAEWKLRNGKWKSKSTFRTKEQALEYARRMEIQVGTGTSELVARR